MEACINPQRHATLSVRNDGTQTAKGESDRAADGPPDHAAY